MDDEENQNRDQAPPPPRAPESQSHDGVGDEDEDDDEHEEEEEEEEEESKKENEEMIAKANKLMEKITSAPDNPKPTVLHALSSIIEIQESRYACLLILQHLLPLSLSLSLCNLFLIFADEISVKILWWFI